MNFINKLESLQIKNHTLLCVGLDPDSNQISSKGNQYKFNKYIIGETFDLVCCYKFQIAYYAANGIKGIKYLKDTVGYLRDKHPEIPIIGDGKRNDIRPTNEMYARELFGFFNFDAITVNPYFGYDSLHPFFKRKEKGIFVVCRTSNKSASDFQDLRVEDRPLYLKIAQKAVVWNKKHQNIHLVVGSTWPEQLANIRKVAPRMILLIPGIGEQKGNLQLSIKYGLRKDHLGLIISSSRSIIYHQDPYIAALKLRDDINKYRKI